MKQYEHIGPDAKVIPGRTILLDVARAYDVLSVVSGKMPGPVWPRRRGGSSAESCAMYGARVRERKQEA
jgi:hypothetical protein